MKTARRILASIMTIVMVLGVCTVAASAATSLQALIDATAEGGTLTLTKSYNESVVINKAITLDLNGFEVRGAEGERAIIVNAESTIKNGRVTSMFADVPSMEMIQTVKSKAFAAIKTFADLTLENVRAIGAYTRIPTTSTYFIPTGSAVETVGEGTDLVLNNVALIGRYAVNNDVASNTSISGGTVTVYDGLLLGFMGAVKDESKVVIADETTKVNAADRIDGLLAGNIGLDESETDLVNSLISDRCYIYTKDPVVNAPVLKDGWVTAEVDDSNDLSLYQDTVVDFSYKWVPSAAVLADDTQVPFEVIDGEYKAFVNADEAKVIYRLWYEMAPDLKDYVVNFAEYAETFLRRAIRTADSAVDKVYGKYDEYIEMIADAYYQVDSIGAEPIPVMGGTFSDIEDFFNIQKALFELGGRKMYEKAFDLTNDETYTFGLGTYYYFYGKDFNNFTDVITAYNEAGGDAGNYGIVDDIDDLIEEFLAFDVTDTAQYADIAYWVYSNYQRVITLMDTAQVKLDNLNVALSTDMAKLAVETAGLEKYLTYLETIDAYLAKAVELIDKALANDEINALITKIENNEDKIGTYVNKVVDLVENVGDYVTFTVEGDYVKAYAAPERIAAVAAAADTQLNVSVSGLGLVDVTIDGVAADSTTSDNSYAYAQAATLSAASEGFIAWVNSDTLRIISTEETLTVATKVPSNIQALYEVGNTFIFTGPTGQIYGFYDSNDAEEEIYADYEDAYVPGLAFTGWPTASGELAAQGELLGTSADIYAAAMAYTGNSAFDDATDYYYGKIVKANNTSSAVIIAADFETADTFTVSYTDNGVTKSVTADANDVVKFTATGDNFSYWVNESGEIVSVCKTYEYTAVHDLAVTAVYGETAPDAVVTLAVANTMGAKGAAATFYVERSSKVKVISSGVLLTYAPTIGTDDEQFRFGTDGLIVGKAKFNTAQGVYAASLYVDTINANGGVVCARPFIETADGIFYGDIIVYGEY